MKATRLALIVFLTLPSLGQGEEEQDELFPARRHWHVKDKGHGPVRETARSRRRHGRGSKHAIGVAGAGPIRSGGDEGWWGTGSCFLAPADLSEEPHGGDPDGNRCHRSL